MIAGNYEEWTVYNRSFSDHPWHLHQNHVLITKINGVTLPLPEWHDTLLVPAASCPLDVPTPSLSCEASKDEGDRLGYNQPRPPRLQPWAHTRRPVPMTCAWADPGNINHATPGSITFRVYFNPITVGCFVAHCHIIDHEDIGMMQRFDILPAAGQPSGCSVDVAVSSQICRSCWR